MEANILSTNGYVFSASFYSPRMSQDNASFHGHPVLRQVCERHGQTALIMRPEAGSLFVLESVSHGHLRQSWPRLLLDGWAMAKNKSWPVTDGRRTEPFSYPPMVWTRALFQLYLWWAWFSLYAHLETCRGHNRCEDSRRILKGQRSWEAEVKRKAGVAFRTEDRSSVDWMTTLEKAY